MPPTHATYRCPVCLTAPMAEQTQLVRRCLECSTIVVLPAHSSRRPVAKVTPGKREAHATTYGEPYWVPLASLLADGQEPGPETKE